MFILIPKCGDTSHSFLNQQAIFPTLPHQDGKDQESCIGHRCWPADENLSDFHGD